MSLYGGSLSIVQTRKFGRQRCKGENLGLIINLKPSGDFIDIRVLIQLQKAPRAVSNNSDTQELVCLIYFSQLQVGFQLYKEFLSFQLIFLRKDQDYIIDIKEYNKLVRDKDIVNSQNPPKAQLRQQRHQIVMLQLRRLFQAVEGFKQLKNLIITLKTGWLLNRDILIDIAIKEGIYGVQLYYFQVKGGREGYKGAEDPNRESSGVVIIIGSLEVAADNDSSLKLNQIAFYIKLILKDLEKRQWSIVALSIDFLKGSSLN